MFLIAYKEYASTFKKSPFQLYVFKKRLATY